MRQPAVAGRFYPDDPDELEDMISWCFEHRLGPGLPEHIGDSRRIMGAMAPHAGYMCSGMTAARTYRALKEDGLPELYVIIGPDHYGTAMGRTVLCSEDFATPLGVCRSDREVCSRLARRFPDDPCAHSREHAVEVQVPFIQYIDPDPRIVAITMGDQSPGSARELALALKEMYSTVYENRVSMCGYGPTATVMLFSEGCVPRMLGHTDSYEALGMDPGAVVGYASAVFERA